MGINYSALAATAKRLIGPNGARCVLVNPKDGAGKYNPVTKKYDKNEERNDGFCIITEYKDHLVDGTVIRAGDRKAVAVILGDPIPGLSRLEIYNKKTNALIETYQVINGQNINPDGTAVIVTHLHCRKL